MGGMQELRVTTVGVGGTSKISLWASAARTAGASVQPQQVLDEYQSHRTRSVSRSPVVLWDTFTKEEEARLPWNGYLFHTDILLLVFDLNDADSLRIAIEGILPRLYKSVCSRCSIFLVGVGMEERDSVCSTQHITGVYDYQDFSRTQERRRKAVAKVDALRAMANCQLLTFSGYFETEAEEAPTRCMLQKAVQAHFLRVPARDKRLPPPVPSTDDNKADLLDPFRNSMMDRLSRFWRYSMTPRLCRGSMR